MSKKPVLIVEHCLDGLTSINEEAKKEGKYILGGTFTEFNVKNRNDRIYTADKFLPHLEELNKRKEQLGVVYGEFDHPDVFDTSLSRVSHLIESITFNQEKNLVEGTIRLLNTHWGKEAKALVDDGCPIFVSSRAAGVTESDGTVTVKKLFTYDAVADPGFGSARMEVKSLNESLGFNESANFRIYDLSDESKINELFEMNNNDEMVTKTQMKEYSNYLTEEIEKFKTEINEKVKTGDSEFDPIKLNEMFEYYENLQESQTKIAKYLDYLAEQVQVVANENVSLKKTTTDLATHSDYLAENLEKSINYTEYLAEHVDKSIDYGKYIAETLDKNIDFSEYIAEHVDKNIKYSEYLAESLDKSIDYTEYVAESLDKSIDYSEYIAENVDKSIEYSEYIAENLDKSIEYTEYIAESLDKSIEYSEYIAEHVDNNISYSEYIAENLDDSMAYTNYIAESLDKSIEGTKKLTEELKTDGKLNETFELIEEQDFAITNTEQYYKQDDAGNVEVTGSDVTADQPVVAEPGAEVVEEPVVEPAVEPIEGEAPVEEPIEGELPVEEPIEGELPLDGELPVEEPIEGAGDGMTPGEIVAYGDTSGEVLASNPQNGIVTIQLDSQEEPIEVHESKVTRLGDKIYNSEKSLQDNISRLIYETKKRKASEQDEPNFLLFLSEKKKAAYYNLLEEDKAKVNIALKESEGKYTTEDQVLAIINEALSPKSKTFNDLLIDSMPADLTQIWENLEPKVQQSVLNQAKLFPNLNTEQKFESFWNSRDLQRYTNEKPAKKVLNENTVVNDVTISDDELERMKAVFERLNG